jgi:hypothetical protein
MLGGLVACLNGRAKNTPAHLTQSPSVHPRCLSNIRVGALHGKAYSRKSLQRRRVHVMYAFRVHAGKKVMRNGHAQVGETAAHCSTRPTTRAQGQRYHSARRRRQRTAAVAPSAPSSDVADAEHSTGSKSAKSRAHETDVVVIGSGARAGTSNQDNTQSMQSTL